MSSILLTCGISSHIARNQRLQYKQSTLDSCASVHACFVWCNFLRVNQTSLSTKIYVIYSSSFVFVASFSSPSCAPVFVTFVIHLPRANRRNWNANNITQTLLFSVSYGVELFATFIWERIIRIKSERTEEHGANSRKWKYAIQSVWAECFMKKNCVFIATIYTILLYIILIHMWAYLRAINHSSTIILYQLHMRE